MKLKILVAVMLAGAAHSAEAALMPATFDPSVFTTRQFSIFGYTTPKQPGEARGLLTSRSTST